MRPGSIKIAETLSKPTRPVRQSNQKGFRALPEEGFISAPCKNNRCNECPSLRCSHACHKRGGK